MRDSLENCAMVEVEFLHPQPFISCHLHFVIVECAMMGKVHQSVEEYVTKQ